MAQFAVVEMWLEALRRCAPREPVVGGGHRASRCESVARRARKKDPDTLSPTCCGMMATTLLTSG